MAMCYNYLIKFSIRNEIKILIKTSITKYSKYINSASLKGLHSYILDALWNGYISSELHIWKQYETIETRDESFPNTTFQDLKRRSNSSGVFQYHPILQLFLVNSRKANTYNYCWFYILISMFYPFKVALFKQKIMWIGFFPLRLERANSCV